MPQNLYHGTSVSKADSLQQHGIIEERLQSRDRGFFGEGLYVTPDKEIAQRHADTVAQKTNGEPEIIQITTQTSSIFEPGQIFPSDGSIRPTGRPEWHKEFISWYLEKLEDAAVWEKIESASRDEILSRGRKEMDPESDQFDREQWYQEVTAYGFAEGYSIVWWTDSEVIINPTESITVTRNTQ